MFGGLLFLVFILGLYDLLALMCLALTVVVSAREKKCPSVESFEYFPSL